MQKRKRDTFEEPDGAKILNDEEWLEKLEDYINKNNKKEKEKRKNLKRLKIITLDQISDERGIIKLALTVYTKQQSPEFREAKFRQITAQMLSCSEGILRIRDKEIQIGKSSSTKIIEIFPASIFELQIPTNKRE